jgi:hypothetical protein
LPGCSDEDAWGASAGSLPIYPRPAQRPPLDLLFAGLLLSGLFVGGSAMAASIPAWLDEAISNWNEEHPQEQIQFVAIKNEFVWYTIPKTSEKQHEQIRESVYGIAESHGYARTEDEESVTLARPPVPSGPSTERKCWSRSFTQDRDTGHQRLLTSLVCVATPSGSPASAPHSDGV